MEGPSLYLAQQQLAPFIGKVVLSVEGNTTVGKEQLDQKKVIDIFSWGKHLVFQFDSFAVRIHFLLFGTFEATVDDKQVTGDYKKKIREPRLALVFENGHLEMYSCSVKIIDDENVRSSYNFAIDIMSEKWDEKLALQQMKASSDDEVSDILLEQTIFAGVGNIIKNEVLSIARIHPQTKISDLAETQLTTLITTTHQFSHQFYEWRKAFMLRKNLKIHRKKYCPHCGNQISRQKTGKKQRWSYWCDNCQLLP